MKCLAEVTEVGNKVIVVGDNHSIPEILCRTEPLDEFHPFFSAFFFFIAS